MDLGKFTPLDVADKEKKKRGGRKGALTIICSKNGNRLMISKELAEILDLTSAVKMGFIDKDLVLGKCLPGNSNEFSLKKQGEKLIVYSAEAVRLIAQTQQISFENCVSFTWYEPLLDDYENSPVAIFKPEGGDNCEE